MFYEFYTILYKVSQDSEQQQPQVPETEKEDEDEDSEDEEEVAGRAAASRHPNPYAEFLAAITDSPEEEGAGLMGGLKSWLGFAGSMTGTAASVLGDSGPNKPWLRGDKGGGEDTMTKKAEEHMSKIAGDFCNWLRDLPGEDTAVNSLGETQLRALFDTAQAANPGTTKLAEGLRSWAKFGSTVTGAEQSKKGSQDTAAKPMLGDKKFAERLLGVKGGLVSRHLARPRHVAPRPQSERERRLYYGAWYVEPGAWQRRHGRQLETRGGAELRDKTKARLGARLPGPVDMMGFQQPVAQLQATKAFAQYLNEQKGYKKPNFIKHIIKCNEKEK